MLIMAWKIPLPENCPPEKAFPPNNFKLYRMVDTFPPTKKDFLSHRELYPNKKFNASECVTRSISLLKNEQEASRLRKYPSCKNKIIAAINLSPENGLISQTGRNRNHYSLWMKKEFDPIPACSSLYGAANEENN